MRHDRHARMLVPGSRELPLGEFGRRLWRAVSAHAMTDTAAQLSYYAIFSLFPFLFFLVTLTAFLPLGPALAEVMFQLAEIMPPDAHSVLQLQVAALLDTPRPRLLTAGLAVTLWSASRGVDALRKGLNLAYDVKESRSFWHAQGLALAVTAALSLLVLASVSILLVGGQLGGALAARAGAAHGFELAWSWLRWPSTAAVAMLAVAVAYYALPDVKQEFRYITPGSVLATLLWLGATWVFTQLVAHFGHYDVTYGSIGGVVVLMTWLYLSGLVLLLGGEVNAVIEHASPGGKAQGARAPGEPAPPPWQRPSAMPPSVVKAEAAGREAGGA